MGFKNASLFAMTLIFPASSAQKRFFFDGQTRLKDTATSAYRIPLVFAIDGQLDVKQLQEAVETVIRRHAVLRTKLEIQDGQLVQEILKDFSFHITENHEADDPFHYGWTQDFGASGVNMHCCIFSQQQRLIFIWHHHAMDGFAVDLFFNELQAIFRHEVLDDPWQYVDWSSFENQWLATDDFRNEIDKWKGYLKNCSGVTPLPCDRHVSEKISKGSLHKKKFSAVGLARFLKSNRLSANDFIGVINAILLHKLSGEESSDFCLGTLYSNRYRPELEQMLGCCVNTTPRRFCIDKETKILSLI